MISVIKRHFNAAKNLIFSKTAKSAYITTVGGGLNSFLSFVFTVLVARALTPADFGLFSAVLNLLIVLFVFSDLGLSSSILRFLPSAVKRKDETEEGRIIKTSFLITASLGMVLSVIVFLFARPLAEIFLRQPALSMP
ncbi:MAG: oligosaccharide flippase family protein, partial [bacterium]|nr:oligosaccharide flippase family protein [bacterium]